jgi:molybdenum cofactor biosynthesis protein B
MGHREHHRDAPRRIATVVLTVSDTRTSGSDSGGRRIRRLLERAGHRVAGHRIVPDDPSRIRGAVRGWLRDPGVSAIILTGGTGVAPRDRTLEAVEDLFEKRLDGFGEIFRMLSYRQVGSSAILSRAAAGVAAGRVLFVLPGSEKAVDLAMRRLILPEIGHLVAEITKCPRAARGTSRGPMPPAKARRRR